MGYSMIIANPASLPNSAGQSGQQPVFSNGVMRLDDTIQKDDLHAKLGMTMRRQGLHEIFQHETHPPHDLDADCTAMTNFRIFSNLY